MATTQEFIEYVCEQIYGIGTIRYKKMFGEYMVYINEKPVVIVCDDTAYVKTHNSIDTLMANSDKGFPYSGAKEHYILDIDNGDFCKEVVKILEPHLQIPKPKKKKQA